GHLLGVAEQYLATKEIKLRKRESALVTPKLPLPALLFAFSYKSTFPHRVHKCLNVDIISRLKIRNILAKPSRKAKIFEIHGCARATLVVKTISKSSGSFLSNFRLHKNALKSSNAESKSKP